MNIKITGTGSYLPPKTVTNEELAKLVDTSDEWIQSRTGIKERHIADDDMETTDMAVLAAMEAISNSGTDPSEIDIIIVATSSADKKFPSCACEVQSRIGAVHAAAFDISAACSGFIFALNVMSQMCSGTYKTGLIIGADMLSRLTDWTDRGTCVLFGDGAGAAIVKKTDSDTDPHTYVMGSDGSGGPVLSCVSGIQKPGYITMNGQEVFKFAVRKVPECINEVLDKADINADEIKYFILHQANKRIFEAIAKRLDQPLEKFPMNIDRCGNTSGASVPIMLDELNRSGRLTTGDKIILAGFGAGLTWGASFMEW